MLLKKNNGVRPIAISNTLRRIASKIVAKLSLKCLEKRFSGRQLGIGTRSGCEIAVHKTREFITLNENQTIVKIDFKNAFNTLNRNIFLKDVMKNVQIAAPFIEAAYSKASFLLFNDEVILSEEGVQQGDPLGPLIFCLSLQSVIDKLTCPLNLWYMDDGIIGGTPDTILRDMNVLEHEASKLGLKLNRSKCEILQPEGCNIFPEMKMLTKQNVLLLGAPVTREATTPVLLEKQEQIIKLAEKLKHLPSHYAFKIIQVSMGSPNLISILRSSPCNGNVMLQSIDEKLKNILEECINISLTDEKWNLASFPIKMGGLGFRQSSGIAIPAYLSSFCNAKAIFPDLTPSDEFAEYQASFLNKTNMNAFPNNLSQKNLDCSMQKSSYDNIFHGASIKEKARMQSASHKNSGDWLKSTPNEKLGLSLSNDEFRVATCLRLGLPIVEPHQCKCEKIVDALGEHCFACSRNNGKILRHTMLNECISRTLKSIRLPNKTEPTTIGSHLNIRPDGVTLIPYQKGKPLAWDVSCPHPICDSHMINSSFAGAAATSCEAKKTTKYRGLNENYVFMPIIIDSIGAYGRQTAQLIEEIGRRLNASTGTSNASNFFKQRLSINIQKGNKLIIYFDL